MSARVLVVDDVEANVKLLEAKLSSEYFDVLSAYNGRSALEIADSDELYQNPLHPYSQAHMSAIPAPDPKVECQKKRIILQGDVPSPVNPPPGCNFNPRCWKAQDICREVIPPLEEKKPNHFAACHFPG